MAVGPDGDRHLAHVYHSTSHTTATDGVVALMQRFAAGSAQAAAVSGRSVCSLSKARHMRFLLKRTLTAFFHDSDMPRRRRRQWGSGRDGDQYACLLKPRGRPTHLAGGGSIGIDPGSYGKAQKHALKTSRYMAINIPRTRVPRCTDAMVTDNVVAPMQRFAAGLAWVAEVLGRSEHTIRDYEWAGAWLSTTSERERACLLSTGKGHASEGASSRARKSKRYFENKS